MIDKQHNTHRKYKQTGDPYYLNKYKQHRRNNKKELKKLKRNYLLYKICKPLVKGNSKPFYKHLRYKQNQQHPSETMTLMDGLPTTDSKIITNELNKYFHSQFCHQESISKLRLLLTQTEPFPITLDGVEKPIVDLKNNRSPGPDQIQKCQLLINPNINAECFQHIFAASLKQGVLPAAWKTANITPMYNKGEKEKPCNYRPMSLTSIPCKMLEHILHYLNKTLDSILVNRQHGFRRGLSCDTQLCANFHDLARVVDNSSTTHAVILDFKKAFDKLPHLLLIEKIR